MINTSFLEFDSFNPYTSHVNGDGKDGQIKMIWIGIKQKTLKTLRFEGLIQPAYQACDPAGILKSLFALL